MTIDESTEDFLSMYEGTKDIKDYIEDTATGRIRITKTALKVYRVPMARAGININNIKTAKE
jgi:hypothetical protein